MGERSSVLAPTLIGLGIFFVGYLAGIYGLPKNKLVENEALAEFLFNSGLIIMLIGAFVFLIYPALPSRKKKT